MGEVVILWLLFKVSKNIVEGFMNKVKICIVCLLLGLNFGVNSAEDQSVAGPLEIEVYRSPSCGCCSKWLDHLKQNQFKVKDNVINDVQAIKDKYGVPVSMASCHTALINGYVVEGHVPADDIKKLLKLKPPVVGVSVPGMPVGTPGMEMGGKKDDYNVVSFDKNNKVQIFSEYKDN